MTITVVVALVVVLVLWFEWWGRKPTVYRGVGPSELPSFFGTLLERGHEGGLMFVQPETVVGTEPFLQFTKYDAHRNPGLRFAFPLAPWSELFFERVVSSLQASGYPVITEETGDTPVRRFAIVNLGKDVNQAGSLALAALSAMGHDGHKLKVWYEGVGPGPLRGARQ